MSKSTRILIIVENLPVPFDTRVWKQAQALTRNGYKVFVLCPKGRGYEKPRETIEGVEIYRHPALPEANGAIGYVAEYTAALLWEFLFTWWIFLRHGFRIIQGCNPPDTIFLISSPFKLFGVRYIFDHHDVCPELFEAKFGRRGWVYRAQLWLEKLTFRVSDVVMSTNESYRRVAIDRGGRDPQDVFVVRNGPDIDRFKPVAANERLKKGRRYLVGYVGTMAAQEGLAILLRVAARIRALGRDDVYFICVGGGPGLDELKALRNDLNLGEMVEFTGRVPDRQLLEILSTADVCVNPDEVNAMNDMSTMIKIMEYMALHKPIVQFDLKEGRYSAQGASIYAENSVEDFADKILWLLDHPEERAKMGRLGHERVMNELAWQHSIPNLLAAYTRAAAK